MEIWRDKMEFIKAKSLLSGYGEHNGWFYANYNMNIYRGCSHGCIYCDSRSECYQIQNFDQVKAKDNALEILSKELRGKRKKGVIACGAMSDPYNPQERKYRITRGALELIDKNGFGIALATKSDLIARDIDIFKRIKKHSPQIAKITVTTVDDNISRKIEPYVSTSTERFKAIEKFAEEGLFSGVLMMPILPFLCDSEDNIRGIVRKTKESGGKFVFAYGMGVTLRGNQRDHFFCELQKRFPENNYTQMYRDIYGNSYSCESSDGKKLRYIFKNECEKLGLLYKMSDIGREYKKGYEEEQLSFF